MFEAYWVHSDGKVDAVPAESFHLDFLVKNPEKFGVSQRDAKAIAREALGYRTMRVFYRIYKNHWRVGLHKGSKGIEVYAHTLRLDEDTFSKLKRYVPTKLYRGNDQQFTWESFIDGAISTTVGKFMGAKNINQLTQKDTPEYHKIITQYRESIRDIVLSEALRSLLFRKQVRPESEIVSRMDYDKQRKIKKVFRKEKNR
jgi:hypothetical protein